MKTKTAYTNRIAGCLIGTMAVLFMLLFVVQPAASAFTKKKDDGSVIAFSSDEKKADSPQQEEDNQPRFEQASYNAVVPVGTVIVAQVPVFKPLLVKLHEAVKIPSQQMPLGVTRFLKTLFNRIIAPNAP